MKVCELFETDTPMGEIDYEGEATEKIEKFNSSPNIKPTYLDISSSMLKKVPLQVRDMPEVYFVAYENYFKTFENFPKIANGYDLSDNKFTSLHDIHKSIHEVTSDIDINFIGCPLKSHVLGLLKIKGLHKVALAKLGRRTKLSQVENIINRYLPNNRGNDAIVDCQNELIDAGFEEYAQL